VTFTRSLQDKAEQVLPQLLWGAISETRRELRRVRRFLRDERKSPVAFSAPGLVARGYLSERQWLYPTRPSRQNGYLSDLQYRRVRAKLNPPQVIEAFADKRTFALACEANGLADHIPRDLATVVDGRITALVTAEGPVALKLSDGARGEGFALFADAKTALAACPATGSYIVQEKVVNHAYAREIFPGSLNTLRILALRDRAGGKPRIAVAVHRIGSARTAPVDSFSAGGLLARVDLETATLSYAVGPVTRRARDTWESHPDTGALIAGRVVPHFPKALALVLHAMTGFPDALHIAWDVAISERGPLIIEGNARIPACGSVQAHGPFADQPVCREFYQSRGLLPRG
jgi:hypothetical protein